MKKAELRKQILTERDSLLLEQRHVWDKRILERLLQYDIENPCDTSLCYVNYKSEADTKAWIHWCFYKGKAVFVPKVLAAGEMEFYQIFHLEDLKAGCQGILEPEDLPDRSFRKWIGDRTNVRSVVRMIIPGAVFDQTGNRIGYGGGYYDKWIARWENEQRDKAVKLEKIGIAYQMQIVEEIPAEPYDQKVDLVVTEKGITYRKTGNDDELRNTL